MKQFPGRVASAFVDNGPFKGAPAVPMTIDTPWHGEPGTPTVLPPPADEQLTTVAPLARSCLVAAR